jgi:hypothetical protein
MLMTLSELASRKSSDFEYQSHRLCGCGPWRWYKCVGEIHMDKGRVGEESRGKKMDGCLLTVRGHPSISLLPLSSPTLPLSICIPHPYLCIISKDHTYS